MLIRLENPELIRRLCFRRVSWGVGSIGGFRNDSGALASWCCSVVSGCDQLGSRGIVREKPPHTTLAAFVTYTPLGWQFKPQMLPTWFVVRFCSDISDTKTLL